MKYIKRFNEAVNSVIDLTDQYKSGSINHKAQVGEVISINHNGSWIHGEVFLTKDMMGYHGGFINNIDEYMNKTALYLTRSIKGATFWNLKGLPYTRVYEVKIKDGIKFIGSSPAGHDHNGLNDEKKALLPMGIFGMCDNNFKNNTHDTNKGAMGSEGLVLDKSVIAEFRAIPFKELLENEEVKKTRVYEDFVKWYHELKTFIFYTMEEYKEYEKNLSHLSSDNPFDVHVIDFNTIPEISDKIDQTIESMEPTKLRDFIKSKGITFRGVASHVAKGAALQR
jgi:hypothetical protein